LKLIWAGVPKAKHRRRKNKAISCQEGHFDEMVSLQAGDQPGAETRDGFENPDC
jgi:hypothetical protein